MPDIFPIRRYASDLHGWANCPDLAKAIWMRIRPPTLSWYAVDMEILSPTKLNLSVYEMADNFHGGIGKKIHEQEITEFTDKEKEMIDGYILNEYTMAACREYERLEDEARTKKVMAIRLKMFGV